MERARGRGRAREKERGRGRYAGVVIWYAAGRFVPTDGAFGTPEKIIFRS